jgi:hypothetical protein
MCLIAVARKRSDIPAKNLKNAHTRNKDGWGIMYAHEGRVVSFRGTGDHKEFLEVWDGLPDVPIAVHFRYRTKGPKDLENCHPFKVLDFERDGQDIFLMHNGPQVARDCEGDDKRSDTLEFTQDLVAPLLRGKPRFVRTMAFRRIMQNMIETEKLVFLEGCGKWHFANYDEGEVIEGVWYSNTYSIEEQKWWKGASKKSTETQSSPYVSDGLKSHWSDNNIWDNGKDYAAHWGRYHSDSNRWLYPEELANLANPPFDPAACGFTRKESGVWSVPESASWDYNKNKWVMKESPLTVVAATNPNSTSTAYACPMKPEETCTECLGDCALMQADESKLLWKPENVRAMNDSELLDAVWEDADGAADLIRELIR